MERNAGMAKIYTEQGRDESGLGEEQEDGRPIEGKQDIWNDYDDEDDKSNNNEKQNKKIKTSENTKKTSTEKEEHYEEEDDEEEKGEAEFAHQLWTLILLSHRTEQGLEES